jgi:hypothetical protein
LKIKYLDGLGMYVLVERLHCRQPTTSSLRAVAFAAAQCFMKASFFIFFRQNLVWHFFFKTQFGIAKIKFCYPLSIFSFFSQLEV